MYDIRKRHRKLHPDGSLDERRFLGGGGGGGTNTTISKVEPWEPSTPALTQGLDWLQQWGQFLGSNPSQLIYTGPRVADFAPDQTYAAQNVENLVANDQTAPIHQRANELLAGGQGVSQSQDALQQTWNNLLSPVINGQYLTADSNPYAASYVQAAQAPITQNYQNTVLPALRTSDAYGLGERSASGLAQANAANDYMQQLGNVATNTYFPMYNTERGYQQSTAQMPLDLFKFMGQQQNTAADQLSNWLDQQFQQQGYLATVGDEQQKYNQAQIEAARQAQQEGIYNYLDAINAYLGSAYGLGSVGRTQTQQSSPYSPGLGQTLLGGGSTLAGLGGMLGLF